MIIDSGHSISFPEPYRRSGGNIKVELDLFSYAKKPDLKEATCIDTSTLTSKADLVIKIDAIYTKIPSTNGLVTKTQYDSDKQGFGKNIDKKIPSTTGLVKKTDYNREIKEIENKIPGIIGLATPTMLYRKTTQIESNKPYC